MNDGLYQRLYANSIAVKHGMITLLSVLVFSLGGCTSTTGLMALAQTHPSSPIKMIVLQTPMTIKQERLKAVFGKELPENTPLPETVIQEQENRAQEHARATINNGLARQHSFVVVPTPTDDPIIHTIENQYFDTPMTQDDADRIALITDSDAILKYKITDYGLTPVAWRKAYVTFEITSTLAIAGSIALIGTKAARTAGAVYLAEEGTEELAEGYAGFWAFNEVCRPVRIEAELIRLKPVKTIWKTSDTGTSDIRLSRIIRKIDSKELDDQLMQSTDHAASTVVKRLTEPLKDISHH